MFTVRVQLVDNCITHCDKSALCLSAECYTNLAMHYKSVKEWTSTLIVMDQGGVQKLLKGNSEVLNVPIKCFRGSVI